MAAAPVKVEITGNAVSLMDALGKSTAGLKTFSREVDAMGGGLSAALKNLQAPFIALAGLVGGGAFLKGTVDKTKEWTMEASKLSRTLGISTEAASVLNVAIGDIYGNIDEFLPAIGKLTKTLNTNEGAFRSLGVATRDSAGHLRPTLEIMTEVNSRLMTMKSGTDRNVASMQIYGKGWMEVQKYLGLTADVMKAAQEKAEKLNLIVGTDAVKATADYRASMNDLDDTLLGIKLRIGQELMPVLSDFNNAAAEEGPTAITILGTCLKGLVELVDGAWSGFKMFSIGLVGVVNAIIGTIMTALGTAWGFLTRGIPGAREAFKKGNDGLKEDWAATIAALDEVGIAYSQRQNNRWEGTGPHARPQPKPTATGHADTKETHEKQNVYLDEQNRLRAESVKLMEKETLEQKRAEAYAEAKRVLDETLARYRKERTAGTLKAGQAEALEVAAKAQYAGRLAAIDRDLATERKKVNAETLDQISVMENTGIEKQIEAERQKFATINAERKKAGLEGIADSVLAENIAVLKARDMLKNKDTSGRGALAGVAAGADDFIQPSLNKFESWRGQIGDILGGVKGAFASLFRGILSGNMSLSQGLRTAWKGIADTILGALANIAAQYVATAIAQAIFSKATDAASGSATAAATSQAVAETWAAYAPFPYIGAGLALAQIAVMMGSIAAAGSAAPIVAHARGGRIDRPTLALMGEVPGSAEIVAPESTFKDWAGNLTANIVRQERQAQAYSAMGGQYASQAAAAGPGGFAPPLHVHLEGATVMGESVESARIIGAMVKNSLDTYNRRNG